MQISSNYSMNGVPYENRRRQNDIPQFSTERAKQENESINPYMADTDFNEKAFDMIGPNAPQDVKDAWMEAAKEVNANGMGIKKNGMLSHISQMMVQRLNKQMNGEGDVDNIDILGNTTDSAIQATKQALYEEYRLAGYGEDGVRCLIKGSMGYGTADELGGSGC